MKKAILLTLLFIVSASICLFADEPQWAPNELFVLYHQGTPIEEIENLEEKLSMYNLTRILVYQNHGNNTYHYYFCDELIEDTSFAALVDSEDIVEGVMFIKDFYFYFMVRLHTINSYYIFLDAYKQYNVEMRLWWEDGVILVSWRRSTITRFELVNLFRNDDLIESVWMVPKWVPGVLIITRHEHVSDDDFEEFVADYSQYNLRITYRFPINDNRFTAIFNYGIVDQQEFESIIQNDERIRFSMLSSVFYPDYIINPPTVSITDNNNIRPHIYAYVYPNPVRGNDVNFALSGVANNRIMQKKYEISIYNIKGQLQKSSSDFYFENEEMMFKWNLRSLNNTKVSSGVYLYRIKEGDETYTGKFLIIK